LARLHDEAATQEIRAGISQFARHHHSRRQGRPAARRLPARHRHGGGAEAIERLPQRIPTPEANFFAIVISIQQKSGGNLAEALANLARVLRERKKMRDKVKAISSEAKASAGIIGSLPIVVAGLVYLTSPHYIELLWTTDTGRIVLGVCALVMGIGIFIMHKMISFDI
jgi:tight adherence protein B